MFQSSPALSSGRYDATTYGSPEIDPFQSSPALSSGRYVPPRRSACCPRQGFNPRPPFRAGATGMILLVGGLLLGFNPRPPFRAGATKPSRHIGRVHQVSILARPFERALLH